MTGEIPNAVTDLTHDAVNEALLPLIPVDARRILDVGCGTGTFGALLKAGDTAREVVGITLSVAEMREALPRLDAVHLLDLNRDDAPLPPGDFDCVVCSHVLAYFYKAEAVLARLRDTLLARDGVLVAAIPNAVHWRQRLDFLLGRFEYRDYGVLHRGCVRLFDRRGAHTCITASGFEILESRTEGYLPLPGIRRIAPGLASRVDRGATKLLPGLLGTQFLIQARPALPPRE